jgi:squalene-hopene/tetraprenyl-beta-curcumene cyclase
MIATTASSRTADPIALAIHRSQQNLLRLQHPDGYWCGELMVDSTLCSDYILYMYWADQVDPVLEEKCVAHIRRRQLGDGGWNIYEGGPSEINATVKAYFALKLAGNSPDAPWMREGRAAALRLGGIPRMNTYAKLYLALLGQFPWKYLPAIPVELILLPDWFFFNIYEMSSWSRAMLMPLAILNHLKPTRQLPAEKHLHELFPAGLEHTDLSLPRNQKFFSLGNFFISATELFRVFESPGMAFLRDNALEKAEAWMIERMGEGCDGLAAVFPAMLNSIIALRALGYPDDDPVLSKAVTDFEGLFVDDPEDFRIQPCLSPVWDTAINIVALAESGLDPMSEPLQRAANWMYSKEVRLRADWSRKNPHPIASGWAFEFNNVFYPDTDDTAMVLIGLRMIGSKTEKDSSDYQHMFQRSLDWLLSFQCRDGGWAAFDRDVTKRWLEDIPFADHNAILDPTCSDLTGRTLELLGYIGVDSHCRRVQRAIQFLKDTQEEDGSWYGRWGVNYIYGTWQVLRGLRAIGADMKQDWLIRAREWLESCQNEDGGWGETCASYDDPMLKGKGPSTASQTAWAVMGLCAAGAVHSKAVQRGIDFLVRTQNRDGSWTEPETTGTGFPKVFYLRYDMYRNNFPLLALATYDNYRNGVFHRQSHFRL